MKNSGIMSWGLVTVLGDTWKDFTRLRLSVVPSCLQLWALLDSTGETLEHVTGCLSTETTFSVILYTQHSSVRRCRDNKMTEKYQGLFSHELFLLCLYILQCVKTTQEDFGFKTSKFKVNLEKRWNCLNETKFWQKCQLVPGQNVKYKVNECQSSGVLSRTRGEPQVQTPPDSTYLSQIYSINSLNLVFFKSSFFVKLS